MLGEGRKGSSLWEEVWQRQLVPPCRVRVIHARYLTESRYRVQVPYRETGRQAPLPVRDPLAAAFLGRHTHTHLIVDMWE